VQLKACAGTWLRSKAATQRAASVNAPTAGPQPAAGARAKSSDINAVVWETHKLLRRVIPENIDLVPVLEPNLQPSK